ncbi:DUF3306 domain-containing protein [Azospirillum sp. SYSU D00513]|uniref:DUF3306 domain-containing protein n=1 Tax=Azospirillum sp. SYSU D00513 TaxID=2812561 RepID=UPI001FFEFE88|nr:DUF3306 domain-containing protein [Azospirillum sp. SYSU D00513]
MPDSTEGFLDRWSRLKQRARTTEAEAPLPALVPDGEAAREEARAVPAIPPVPDEAMADSAPAIAGPEALPPVESLGEGSDYTAYLAPGVPESLKVAALRKAWCSDPKIADFRGFAEYDWDCNAPGFGQLLPSDNIQELLSNFFREEEPEEPETAPAAEPAEDPLLAEAAGTDGSPLSDPDSDGRASEELAPLPPPDGLPMAGVEIPPEGDPESVRPA